MNAQDFLKGVDITGLPIISGADYNNLIELAVPLKDADETVGKGLILTTTDSAVGVPVVPDASINVKWKRYQWNRRPNLADPNQKVIPYGWNDSAIDDPTLKKWIDLNANSEQITTVSNTANNALATAQDALTTAQVANDTANNAVINTAAQIAAITTQLNAATATANTALANSTSARSITDALLPGGVGQKIRTNLSGAIEWYNDINNYVKVSDTRNRTVDGDNTAIGWNKRTVNTIDSNVGNLCTSIAASVIGLLPGIYRVKIDCHYSNYTSLGGINKAILIDNDTNLVLLEGNNVSSAAIGGGKIAWSVTTINGIINVTNSIKNFTIQHYTSQALDKFGTANNIAFNAIDIKEVYLTAEFYKLN